MSDDSLEERNCFLLFLNLLPEFWTKKFHHIVINTSFISYLEPGSESPNEDSPSTDRLRFDRFDICRLLKHGASLLGSAGAEFEVQDDKSGIYILLADKKTYWFEKVCCGSIMSLIIYPWILRMLGNNDKKYSPA